MKVCIYILKASDYLKKHSAIIERNAWQAVKKIEKKIPVADVDIVFYDNPAAAIPEYCVYFA